MALDKMEKYHNFSNDFQVVSFTMVHKEALDNIVDMFEDEGGCSKANSFSHEHSQTTETGW